MNRLPLSNRTRDRLDRVGQEFLVEFYAAWIRRMPEDVGVLAELGHALTRLGRHEEGLAIDRRLVRLVPDDPITHYNLACSYALLQHCDEALDALERSIDLGYEDADFLLGDEDLTSVREEPRFQSLVRRLRARDESRA